MTGKVIKNWEREPHESIFTRIKEKIHPGPPLKQRLSNSIYRLQVIYHKLQNTITKMEQKEKMLFNKCAEAQSLGDSSRAAIYANECAEVRKMIRTLLRSQMAVEQVILRLETIRDFGDVAVQMSPVVLILQSCKSQLAGIMPEVSYELGTISETLNSLVLEAGEAVGAELDVVVSGEEAQKILKEASMIAEQKMSEKFPEIPLNQVNKLPTPNPNPDEQ